MGAGSETGVWFYVWIISVDYRSNYLYIVLGGYLFACRYWTWICLDITCFNEEQFHPSSGSAWPFVPKTENRVPHCWGEGCIETKHFHSSLPKPL